MQDVRLQMAKYWTLQIEKQGKQIQGLLKEALGFRVIQSSLILAQIV